MPLVVSVFAWLVSCAKLGVENMQIWIYEIF